MKVPAANQDPVIALRKQAVFFLNFSLAKVFRLVLHHGGVFSTEAVKFSFLQEVKKLTVMASKSYIVHASKIFIRCRLHKIHITVTKVLNVNQQTTENTDSCPKFKLHDDDSPYFVAFFFRKLTEKWGTNAASGKLR